MGDLPIISIHPPGTYVEIDGDALYLGRDSHLAALIPSLLSKVVSNRHCVIQRHGDRWVLEDLGSTNGTWVRGARLGGKMLLHTADAFRLGARGPRVSCESGFGGTGPDRTIPEDELGQDAIPTLVDDHAQPSRVSPMVPAAQRVDDRDGSADRPYRVGRVPTVKLIHEPSGRELTASGYTIVIGRDPAAVQILVGADDEKHVSARHTEIQFRSDGSVVVRDLRSTNGTWLNDRRLKGEAPLKVGDRLLLGYAPTVLVVAALDA